jgi:NAD(P)-dependent dehydrogenase (short-subunit alcohol dehydrogenase family)
MSKIAIVTGASSGIGLALALDLTERGHHVLAVARRGDALATAFADAEFVTPVVADVSTEDGHAIIVAAAKAAASDNDDTNIAFLVHNAAMNVNARLTSLDMKTWQTIMAVNVDGPLFLTLALVNAGLLVSGTRVLNISSGLAHHYSVGFGAYCTSKTTLLFVKNALVAELTADKGILFSSLQPGVVNTPMQDAIRTADPAEVPTLAVFQVGCCVVVDASEFMSLWVFPLSVFAHFYTYARCSTHSLYTYARCFTHSPCTHHTHTLTHSHHSLQAFKADGRLRSPRACAKWIALHLCDTSDADFTEEDDKRIPDDFEM